MATRKNTSKMQKYAIITAIVVALGVAALFLLPNTADKPQGDSGLYPQNGSYTIAEVQDIVCTLSDPPTCSGSVLLSDEEPTRLAAKIDRDTKVRYQTKEIQIYPPELKEGMTTQVTFKPNSATIETIVIVD